MRSQFVTSNTGRGGRRYAPYAFTEQGVAMLSSVLNSPRAVAINIEIMRAFVQVRSVAATHQGPGPAALGVAGQDRIAGDAARYFQPQHPRTAQQVFDALCELMTPPEPPKRPIGFGTPEDKKDAPKGSAMVKGKRA